ncbi:MAG TPA: DUF4105 domain-containing protein, partial [Tepidisphaeraceae bacterium]|nr:DUF4105 domain-containing protein [Tepidisphaeraceae bacterium]
MILCPVVRAGEAKVSVLVFGPGPESWQRFGHIAIRVNPDPRYRSDVCYDWGRFDFEAKGFFTKFIGGQMTYSMGPQLSADSITFYKNHLDRTITEYDLNLT